MVLLQYMNHYQYYKDPVCRSYLSGSKTVPSDKVARRAKPRSIPTSIGGRIHRIGNLLLGLNGEVPVISPPGDHDVSGCPIDLTALTKPHPADLG